MATYLGYVQGGKCKDTHAPCRDKKGNKIKQPMIHKEFWVKEELRQMGIESWCGKRIVFKRQGKKRFAEAIESPYLPNYIFIDLTPEQYIKAQGVKYLASTFKLVPAAEMSDRTDCLGRAIRSRFVDMKERAEEEYEAAKRIEGNHEAISEFKAGEAVRAENGAFVDLPMWFVGLVQKAGDQWPKVEVETEFMGAKRKMLLDPIDVRAAS